MKELRFRILLLVLVAIIPMFCLIGCSSTGTNNNDKYSVSFYIDGEYVSEQKTNDYVVKPFFNEKENKSDVFDGWYEDTLYTKKFNFEQPISGNINLYARNLTYVETLKKLVEKNGSYVTTTETRTSGAEGKAIPIILNLTYNKYAYLMVINNHLSIIYDDTPSNPNRRDTNDYYLFSWNLESNRGQFLVVSSIYLIKFRADFAKEYCEGIKSVTSDEITDVQLSSSYNYNDGISKTKKVILTCAAALDSLISEYKNL